MVGKLYSQIKKISNDKQALAIAFVCLSLFSFNFWLFYPGSITHDWTYVMRNFSLNNWQPVIYAFLLKHLSKIFGNHIYYSLLFNLIPFYLGIYVLVIGCWKKFHSQWCWMGLLPICIGNIFFNSIMMHGSFSSPMFIFLIWTIVLYQILVGMSSKNVIFASIAFIFATISRHNALIQTFPIFFIYSWIIVQKSKPSHKLLKYISWCFLFAGLTLVVSIGIPSFLKEGKSYPTTHILLHQIAGSCVPNNDESCFKPEWYEEGRSFADVEEQYLTHPTMADYMTWPNVPTHPFKRGKLNNLQNMWLKSIVKYPLNYLQHINRFRKILWHQETLQQNLTLVESFNCKRLKYCKELQALYPINELFYNPSTFKITIYDFIKRYFIQIPTIIFISINFILFIIPLILFFKKQNIILLYTISSSVSGIISSVVFFAFSPYTFPRYIYPVIIPSLVSILGIILYFCDNQKLNIIKIKSIAQGHKKIIVLAVFLSFLFLASQCINCPLKARADVYAPYNDTPYFIVHQNNVPQPMSEASWMPKGGNRGVVVQQMGNSMTFTITALEDTNLTIALRGPDERDANGKRYEKWVKYTSFKINGKQILPTNQDVWHDKPFKHTLQVKKNNAYKVKLKWRKK